MTDYVLLGGIGVAFGLLAAGFSYCFGKSITVTLTASAITGTIGGILTIATWEAAESIIYHDYTPAQAMHAFIGAAFLISFASPYLFGVPGALAGGCLHCLIQAVRGQRLE